MCIEILSINRKVSSIILDDTVLQVDIVRDTDSKHNQSCNTLDMTANDSYMEDMIQKCDGIVVSNSPGSYCL